MERLETLRQARSSGYTESLQESMERYRSDLHRIPEIDFDVYRTHAYIKRQLETFGYDIESVAGTGIVAYKEGMDPRSFAFRADMDALQIQEAPQEGMSEHEGFMHACGHDGHMAIVLAFARFLSELELKRSVTLIFQPAEETAGGARHFIEADVLERYNVEAMFGFHLYPEIEEGKIGVRKGLLMGQDGEFDIHIEGMNAHGAQPHRGNDAILAAAQLITQYQTLPGRSVAKEHAAVLNVGTLRAGDARNVIGKDAYLEGSIRTFNHSDFETLERSMRRIDAGIEHAFDVKVTSDIRALYPPLINDADLYESIVPVFSEFEVEPLPPLLLAEDFAYFSQHVPSFFFMLGSRNAQEGFIPPLHSSRFDFTPQALGNGLGALIRIGEHLGLY